ncbi:MAG: DUF1549 domain-containing protein [Pirellulales bacterium]|nr:DUF1549 domain-containing protein [Pirellulales bacterium]
MTALHEWVRNSVDAFVGQKLEAAGLRPNLIADKLTLLRRVTFDLIGLPPTPAEQTEFVSDQSPDAYAKVVDRLLASPRYGERWAEHWLDLVRYSDTDGFKRDDLRPDAYRYRDFVIRALNDDLSYDRFVQQQLAGDELEPGNPDALIATGYMRLPPDEINASDIVQLRQATLDDITENAGLVFLGLTIGCARCHDHKFDEIKQTDYFRLQACFAAIVPTDDATIASPAEQQQFDARMAQWKQATASIRAKIDTDLADERGEVMQEAISAYDPVTLKAINTPPEKRTCIQKQLVAEIEDWIEIRLARAYRRCQPNERKEFDELTSTLAKFDPLKPSPLPTTMAVFDGDRSAAPTYVLAGGDPHKPGPEVTAGFPEFLGASNPSIAPPQAQPSSTGRRSALARWLTRPDHPLTARVLVNRLWHYHFGQGIVATPNDFGVMGAKATHPELLDWLASELIAGGWHLKPIHRLIVLSATYCESSKVDPQQADHQAALSADLADNLLWHARRRRLEGESLRDALLQVSGQLNFRMFGPAALPALPPNLSERYSWDPDPKPEDRRRRSVYVLAKRNLRIPLLEAFDQPDMHNSCPSRSNTTTAPQSLEMLNSEITFESARSWGEKLLDQCGGDETALIRAAYAEAYGRPADRQEIESARQFILSDAAALYNDEKQLTDHQLSVPLPANVNRRNAAAVFDFCHAIMCSNEFLYVD